jgi:hypothetical protein
MDGTMKWGRKEERLMEKRGQDKVYNREEWMKLLRTARNCRILHMAMG